MARRLIDDEGGINFVKLFMLAGVVAAGYFAWVYVPLYADHYAIRQAVRTGCNVAYAHREEAAVAKVILNGFKETNIQNQELAADGTIISRPMDYSESLFDISISTSSPPSVTVDLAYEQQIVLPILNKPRTLYWSYSHTEDLSAIKY